MNCGASPRTACWRSTTRSRSVPCGSAERAGKTEEFWLADLAPLDAPENRDAAMNGTIEDWATESLLAARAAYNVLETGKHLKPGQTLGAAYVAANLPVIRRLLAEGRLAWLPNPALDLDDDDPDDQPITIEGEPLSETIIRERR